MSMLVYATHSGGRYLPISDSLKEQPSGKRNLYVNVTNHCNCSCTFCLRQKKHMAEQSTLWYKDGEPGLDEFKAALDAVPWQYFKEVVFCGFGEPTMRLDVLVELLHYVKKIQPELPTRLNTNGLGNLEYGEDITPKFDKVLDTISISLMLQTPSAITSSRAQSTAFSRMKACSTSHRRRSAMCRTSC